MVLKMGTPKSTKKPAVETRHSLQTKREYNRQKKREERANMSYKKKREFKKRRKKSQVKN